MSGGVWLYLSVALVALATALPTLASCAWQVASPQTSRWNRRAAALWIPIILAVCIAWLPSIFFAVWTWFRDRRATQAALADPETETDRSEEIEHG